MNSKAYSYTAWTSFALVCMGWFLHLYIKPWTQDEGLYLIVARQLAEGGKMFENFAFQQMPIYPHLLAIWQTLIGDSLHSGRFFSFLGLLLLNVLLWQYLQKRGHQITDCAWASVFLLTQFLVWDYFGILKPHAWTLAVLVAAVLITEVETKTERGKLALAILNGLLLGLAANTRLLFVFPIPLFLFFYRKKPKEMGLFVLGLLLVSIPTFLYLLSFPEEAYFNWVRYHQIRGADGSSFSIVTQAERVFFVFKNIQWIPILLLFILLMKRGTSTAFRKDPTNWLLALSAVFLVLSSFRLSPFYDEYMIPILVPTIFIGFHLLLIGRWGRKAIFSLGILSMIFWSFNVQTDLDLYFGQRPEPLHGVRTVEKVGDFVEQVTKPDDPILSWWNGYLYAANRKPMRGMQEGLAVLNMHGKLTPQEHRKYVMASIPQIRDWVEKRIPRLIIVGVAAPEGFEELVAEHYRVSRIINGVRIYSP